MEMYDMVIGWSQVLFGDLMISAFLFSNYHHNYCPNKIVGRV